jgi:hypothetical protein
MERWTLFVPDPNAGPLGPGEMVIAQVTSIEAARAVERLLQPAGYELGYRKYDWISFRPGIGNRWGRDLARVGAP